jgi:O-acetylserine/cysteine efflux transporter
VRVSALPLRHFLLALAVAFAGDHVRRHNLVGAAIATMGIVVLAGYKLASGMTGTMLGFAAIIASAVAWAAGNIVAKRSAADHGADMFALTVWSSLVPPLPLLALGFVFEGGSTIFTSIAYMSPLAWGCVLIMSYGATLFGFGSWNALLHRYPTALISPFALLIPISGLASAAVFLGESLAPAQMAGAALVLVGLVVNVYGLRMRAYIARRADHRR